MPAFKNRGLPSFTKYIYIYMTHIKVHLPLFSFHWHALVHAHTLSEVVPAWPGNLVVGVEEQDLLKGLEGILQVFLLLVCITHVVPRCHVPWLKLHRLLELLDRLVEFVISLVAHSQSIVHLITNKPNYLRSRSVEHDSDSTVFFDAIRGPEYSLEQITEQDSTPLRKQANMIVSQCIRMKSYYLHFETETILPTTVEDS
jgi:hypothetical protein